MHLQDRIVGGGRMNKFVKRLKRAIENEGDYNCEPFYFKVLVWFVIICCYFFFMIRNLMPLNLSVANLFMNAKKTRKWWINDKYKIDYKRHRYFKTHNK